MKEWKIHVIVWAVWFALFGIAYPFRGPSLPLYILSPLCMIIGYVGLFYGIVAVLNKFWDDNRTVTIVGLCILLALHIAFRIYTFHYFLPFIDSNFTFLKLGHSISTTFMRALLWASYISFGAIGYFFSKRSISQLKYQSELEKSLLKTETQLLKAQLNPHFLFNVLNFMYDKSLHISDRLSNSISLLAQILRYSLSSKGVSEKVPLRDELYYLRSFIELNRLRFHESLYVCFEEIGCIEEKKIIPFVLINYVENAFKHGIVNIKTSPVKIKVEANKDSLFFSIENKKAISNKGRVSHGIGNRNIKKRLDYVYQRNYQLSLRDEKEYFYCTLTINE